jgi:large subunit ribosomal protein L25
VIYGRGLDPTLVAVEETLFTRLLPEPIWYTTPLTLVVEGGSFSPTVMITEVKRDLITRTVLSADFHAVSMDETVHAKVPLHVVGHLPASAKGGIVARPAHDLSVEALPGDLPDQIEVNISDLAIGDTVRVSDLALPPGVKALDNPEEVVLVVSPPAKPVEAEVRAGEGAVIESAEPEVIRPQE